MPLGWIDYSREERNKVISVLDLLSEKGTLDELGVAPIRDGFANLFFPGTSTIQTRAKYFLIVPYACRDIEISDETSPERALKTLDNKERMCGERFREIDPDTDGLIGGVTLARNAWVKRPPSEIYWSGLKQYGIYNGTQTIREYLHAMCIIKRRKKAVSALGNRNDDAEEGETDDRNADSLFKYRFWDIPTYEENWFDSLNMKLTPDEGRFLKKKIEESDECKGSLLQYILSNNVCEVKDIRTFSDLKHLVSSMPEAMQADYESAVSFADFIHVLQTVFTLVVTEDDNHNAMDEWNRLYPNLPIIASVDIDNVFNRLRITYAHPQLKKFLQDCKVAMSAYDLDRLKTLVTKREISIKSANRAKTTHPGEFDKDTWYGGGLLGYRFANARSIMLDIFESVGIC